MNLIYAPNALQQLHALPPQIADRILRKMDWFAEQDQPLSFAKKLTGSMKGSWRFRIGDYRVLCRVEEGGIRILIVTAVKHRKDIYKDFR